MERERVKNYDEKSVLNKRSDWTKNWRETKDKDGFNKTNISPIQGQGEGVLLPNPLHVVKSRQIEVEQGGWAYLPL